MRERVGHSFIKATMRKHEAIFGGELAGHYYFRDHSYADCPLLTVVEVLNLMRQKGEPLSELIKPLQRYSKSQEINFEVEDKQGKMDELANATPTPRSTTSTASPSSYPDWWANVRPSNTEPFLRLVLEAKTTEELEQPEGGAVRDSGAPGGVGGAGGGSPEGCDPPRPGVNARATLETKSRVNPARSGPQTGAAFRRLFV